MNVIGVAMVVTCPPAFAATATTDEEAEKATLVESCEARSTETFSTLSDDYIYRNLPLTTETGITYANYYCAVCNSVAEDYSFWKLILQNIETRQIPKAHVNLNVDVNLRTTRLPTSELNPRIGRNNDSDAVFGLNRTIPLCFVPYADELLSSERKMKLRKCFVDFLMNDTGVNWIGACLVHGPAFIGPHFDLTILVSNHNLLAEFHRVKKREVEEKEKVVRTCEPLIEQGTVTTQRNVTTHDENTAQNHSYDYILPCFVPSFSDGCVKVPCLSQNTLNADANASVTISGTKAQFAYHASILKYLSFASLLISLLSILLILVIYALSPSLRSHFVTLQLHCFSAHVFSILTFMAASFVSFKQIPSWFCRGIAISAHFSFLSIFSWTNILAWSIFIMVHRMLTQVSTVASGTNLNTSICGIAFYVTAWAAPLLLVAVGVGLSSVGDNFMDYGSDGLCWMSWKHRGIIYLFLLPSGLALLINIILVSATALSLFQIRSAQAPLLHSRCLTVECIFGVVARMSVSLGLEWMLAFLLYFVPESLSLQYAFVLVVGLHGLWLLVSTLTLRVCHKLYERMIASLLQCVYQVC